jgi:death-on-curing protein
MSEEPWASIISIEEIDAIHQLSIKQFGGDSSAQSSEGCIERSVGAAWTADLYSSSENSTPGLCFSGCLLFYLIMNHCFVDGNKRTAWSSCMECLRQYGLTLNASTDEAEAFCLKIIDREIKNAVEVSIWLAPRLVAFED